MCKEVRTRFAPSPTGYMHIGNLRTALYAYLLTKSKGGKFILRIEDTDQERYVDGAVDVIYRTMADTGLKHDEGPDVGGEYGPYIQSERRGIYKEYAEKLVELGHAYYCFCDKERLATLKSEVVEGKEITVYDKHCLHLSSINSGFTEDHSPVLKSLDVPAPTIIIPSVRSCHFVFTPNFVISDFIIAPPALPS